MIIQPFLESFFVYFNTFKSGFYLKKSSPLPPPSRLWGVCAGLRRRSKRLRHLLFSKTPIKVPTVVDQDWFQHIWFSFISSDRDIDGVRKICIAKVRHAYIYTTVGTLNEFYERVSVSGVYSFCANASGVCSFGVNASGVCSFGANASAERGGRGLDFLR